MFSEANLFSFRGPFGFVVEVRQSVLFLAAIWILIGFSPARLLFDVLTFAILMVSIGLHELGHAWACKMQGIRVREVVIYGGGGYTLPARSLSRREDEFVTAMGPIVNLVIWALASLAQPYVGGMAGSLLYMAGFMNLFLALFNLMPVLPLDGGRLFRLILERFLKPRVAARIAGFVGLVFCGLWVLLLLAAVFGYGFFFLLFIPDFQRHWKMLREGW